MIEFTYRNYQELLAFIKGLKYSITTFRDFPESGPAVILRHDIDVSIKKAVEMAEMDHQLGIHSTFFILLSSPYYNALENSNLVLIKRIADYGHEIGLHYEMPSLKNMSIVDMKQHVKTLVETLQGFIGVPVESVSKHKPAASGIDTIFSEYRDAYSPKYFKEIAYLSDSRMKFGEEDIFAFFRNNPRSQLCIHPVWWNQERKGISEIFLEQARIHQERVASDFESWRLAIEKYLRDRNSK